MLNNLFQTNITLPYQDHSCTKASSNISSEIGKKNTIKTYSVLYLSNIKSYRDIKL